MTKLLIHIGYPKTGTSFLRQWFKKNPNILYTKNGILGFKNTGAICQYVHNPLQPQLPTCWAMSEEYLTTWHFEGGASIDNYFDKQGLKQHLQHACQHLHQLFPQAHILITTRGVDSSIQSLYSQYVRMGGVLTFEQMLKKYMPHFFSVYFNYDFLINTYIETFGERQVTVLPFELLQQNPQMYVKTLENALELPHFEYDYNKKINPSFSAAELLATQKISAWVNKMQNPKIMNAYCNYLTQKRSSRLPKPILWYAKFFQKKSVQANTKQLIEPFLEPLKNKAMVLKSNFLYQKYYEQYLI